NRPAFPFLCIAASNPAVAPRERRMNGGNKFPTNCPGSYLPRFQWHVGMDGAANPRSVKGRSPPTQRGTSMQKTLTAFAAAGALALATIAVPSTADAGCRGCAVGAGVIGGLAAGAIIGGAIANSAPPPPPAAYYPPPAGQFYRHAVA